MSHISAITKEQVITVLRNIRDSVQQIDVISSNRISSIVIRGNDVGFSLEVEASRASQEEPLRKACEEAVQKIAGVGRVTAVLTAHSVPISSEPEKKENKRIKLPLPGVKHIIAVVSGKGGVGKSTTAVNLAVSLQQQGCRVGLVDADIYGPSIPLMMGVQQQPDIIENKMVPLERYGVKLASIGFVMPEGAAAVWRGPMVTKALYQLIRGTAWGELDILLVDMPPGTGDVHLSLMENYPVTGAVVVSTPQEVALIDAEKAINMLEKMQVPVLGMVQNMSFFQIGEERHYLFGRDGTKKLALQMGVECLGEIPIDMTIREGGDEGKPLSAGQSDTLTAQEYQKITKRVIEVIGLV